jgi:L,D-transpeptidase YbiS
MKELFRRVRETAPGLLADLRLALGSPRVQKALLVAWVSAALFLVLFGGVSYAPFRTSNETSGDKVSTPAGLAELRSRARDLERRLARTRPNRKFVVVDHMHNRLYLRDGEKVLLDATCSTGSGFVLTDGTREWVFDTPTGRFTVRSKTKDPVWKKPDWAFVEEGKPIPSDPAERIEYGVMGEYALSLGNGYLIHGTLYERLLGRSVTHGCIRLGRDDLRALYRQTDVGTPVYIF